MTYDITFCQDINLNPERVTPCDMVCLGFTLAFYTFSHKFLVERHQSIHLGEKVFRRIKSFTHFFRMLCTKAGGQHPHSLPRVRPVLIRWLIDLGSTTNCRDTVLFLFTFKSSSAPNTRKSSSGVKTQIRTPNLPLKKKSLLQLISGFLRGTIRTQQLRYESMSGKHL